MATTSDKDKPRLDLGLGAILAAAAQTPEPQVSRDLPVAEAEEWTLGDSSPKVHRSNYEELADKREWGEIVRRAEDALSSDPSVEARAWWIRGHLGAFSMPVTLLAAPMESLCRSVDIAAVSPEVKKILCETALLTVGRLDEVGQRDQSETLRDAMAPLNIKPERDANGRPRRVTSSFRVADFALPTEGGPVGVSPPVEVSVKERSRFGLRALVGSAFTLVALVLCVWDPLNIFVAQLDTAPESFVEDPSGVEQTVEELVRKDPVGRLSAIFYAIDGDSDTSTAPSGGNTPGRLATLRDVAPTDREGASSEGKARLGEGQKEAVNTKGPIEGPDFRAQMERRAVTNTDRGEDLQGGPPKAVLPVAPRDQAFESGRVYRVVVSTSVVSAPSFGGRVIGQLGTGDRVLVEGFLGRWMRLRSRRGRGGYVLSADVEEVPEEELTAKR
jgi:hypothetical protein